MYKYIKFTFFKKNKVLIMYSKYIYIYNNTKK